MPLTPGQILNNRYRIVKLLGQGGFGAVYYALDTNLETPRAVKENLDTSLEAQRQFKREAQILGNLSHPNLPRVTDHFIIPGQGQYLIMDFVEGEDLQEKLDKTGGPLPESQVVPWIEQICSALTYLHSQNPPVIHRDIKPANIRITSHEQAVLVDFGIAKVYDAQLSTTLGAQAVTPGYSPLEQYGLGHTDAQSDIYALGATVYTLLTGQVPPASVDISAGTAVSLKPAHLLNPMISPETSSAISQAMQLKRDKRPKSIDEFKASLLASPYGIGKRSNVTYRKLTQTSQAVASPTSHKQIKKTKPTLSRSNLVFLSFLASLALILVVSSLAYILSTWKSFKPTPVLAYSTITSSGITKILPTSTPLPRVSRTPILRSTNTPTFTPFPTYTSTPYKIILNGDIGKGWKDQYIAISLINAYKTDMIDGIRPFGSWHGGYEHGFTQFLVVEVAIDPFGTVYEDFKPNFFQLTAFKDQDVFEYHPEFSPVQANDKIRVYPGEIYKISIAFEIKPSSHNFLLCYKQGPVMERDGTIDRITGWCTLGSGYPFKFGD